MFPRILACGAIGSLMLGGVALYLIHGPAMLTGRAAKGISHQLRHHGFDEVVEPESFLVTKENHLEPGEVVRATAWGRQVAEQAARSAEARP